MVRKSARWILAILIALTFAGILSLFALPRMRTLLESKLESAVYSLQERLYEQTGLRLGYSYASVVLPYRISFYGVEVFRETRSESAILRRKLLAASEIRLRLDPWAAIFGTPAELLKHAEIGDLDIDLQFPDDQDTLKKITTLFSSDTPGALPRLVIDITGMSASLTQADLRRYSASLSSFQLSTLSGAPEAIIPTALLFIADPAFGENELFIQATMFELRSEADLSRLSASAEVAARLGEIQLASQAMTFEVSSGAFVARAAGMGYELELGYGYGSKEFRGEVKLRGLRPSGVVDMGGGVFEELAGLEYEGEVRGSYGQGGLWYEGEVKVRGQEGQEVVGIAVGGLELAVKGKGDEKGLRGVKAEGVYKGLEVGYEGDLWYEGVGVAGNLRLGHKGEEISGKVEGGRGKYKGVMGGTVGGVTAEGVVVGYEEVEDRYDVTVGGEIGGGKVEGSGSILKGGKGYEAGLWVEGLSVGWVKDVLGWGGVKVGELGIEGGEVSGEFGVRGDYKEVAWVVGGLRGKVRGRFGEVEVRGSGVGDGRGYEVKGVGIGYRGKEVGIEGKGGYGEGELGFEGELRYGGLGYEVGFLYRGEEVRVWGGYGLEGKVRRVSGGGYEGEVKAEGGTGGSRGRGGLWGYRREGEVWGGRGLGRGWAVGASV